MKTLAETVDEEHSRIVDIDEFDSEVCALKNQYRRLYDGFRRAIHDPSLQVTCYQDQAGNYYFTTREREFPMQEFIDKQTGVTK